MKRPTPICENLSFEGYRAHLPAVLAQIEQTAHHVPPSFIAFKAPECARLANEEIILKNRSSSFLSYQDVSDFVLTCSNGATLKCDVDYKLDERGAVIGLPHGRAKAGPVACHASYVGWKQRADLVVLNTTTGMLEKIEGADVVRAPAMFEPGGRGGPPVGAHQHPIWRTYVWAGGVDLAPVHLFKDRLPVNRNQLETKELERSRRAVSLTRDLAKRGEKIVVTWTGDSTAAYGGGGSPEDLNTTFGGPRRDVLGFFRKYSREQRALIPITGARNKIQEGPYWRVVKQLERLGGEVEARNRGIAGTTSGDGSRAGFFNGAHPLRLATTLGDRADLLMIGFGQNEIGSPDTASNLRNLIGPALDDGTEVLIVMPNRRSPFYGDDGLSKWLFTCRELLRLAQDMNVGIVRSDLMFAPGRLGAAGMSERELCDDTRVHHPGIKEGDVIGDYACLLF
jgi:hypothetical protein